VGYALEARAAKVGNRPLTVEDREAERLLRSKIAPPALEGRHAAGVA